MAKNTSNILQRSKRKLDQVIILEIEDQYKLNPSKRPEQTLSPYQANLITKLAILPSCKHSHSNEISHKEHKPWFNAQPLGVNKLNFLMKNCAIKTGIRTNKRLTNHSARKTLVQKVQKHNKPPIHIAQATDHKNLHAINNYICLREEQ